ncbi:uncharacterized protein LOC111850577 isoform X1 [Arapaima gigas]
MKVNNTVSPRRYLSYFKLTRKHYCTKLSWWGTCEMSQVAPFAIFKYPALYNSLEPRDKHLRVPLIPAASDGHQNATMQEGPAPKRQLQTHQGEE